MSESKTRPILGQAVLNMNDYLYQLGYRSITYQWIPSHVGTHGSEVADKRATAASRSSSLCAIPLSRSDSKFIIRDAGRNLNRSL